MKIKAIVLRLFALILLLATSFCSATYAQHGFEWTAMSPPFAHGTSNLVAYIDFGEVAIWGNVEVSLTSSFNNQNTTGLYRKSYNIGRNVDYLYSNTSEVTSALGPVADQWKLGDFEVNSANHLVIPVYHLVSTGNSIIVNIRGVSTSIVNVNLINITAPVVLANNQTRDYNYINGKLSIGTPKAEDDALLTVAGNIKSREIKVKIDAGADFVFDKEYKLPGLDSIEHFVKTNNHLPGITPANEMIVSGLDVGNFQIKLLQKIEELTLHLIEQNKKMDAMQKTNNNLTKRVSQLENKK